MKRVLSLLCVVTMLLGIVPLNVFAAVTGTRPSDGTTANQPFPSGTGGSANFRIPAMVTLDDGTIVTACDARWDTTADGGGLDTIVSYSTDNGATWNYTFANYLGDNGNSHNNDSTAFIDPSLATDGSTVYMLVDLFTHGVALNGAASMPSTETGFDSQGRLILTKDDSPYQYYLSNNKIYNSSTNEVIDGYTVDE
ncbi:MAG: glycoside hydrolase, partial [Clostridia bacterium]|nr:glycoside hydrolase [Clostridia bacterium]